MLAAAVFALAMAQTSPPRPMIVVEGKAVRVQQPPPHNGQGMSTADRISDAVPGRNFEFRRRVLHKGATIGLHPLTHDEVYYVISGRGEVTSDGVTTPLGPEAAAYLFEGANVGIRQVGDEDLVLIIAYPLGKRIE